MRPRIVLVLVLAVAPGGVIRAGGAPNAKSLDYVNRVMSLWKSLNGCR